MGELAPQAAQTEVYATPTPTPTPTPKTLTVWRALLSWLTFFFQVVIQLLRGTPSLTRFLSFTSFRHRFLLSSSSFDPLPVVELSDERDYSSSAPPPPPPSPLVHLSTTTNDHTDDDGDGDGDGNGDDHHRFQKLTVVLDLDETLVSAYETSALLPIIRKQARDAGLMSFDLECKSLDKECDGKPKVNYVTVFERPGLQEFLKQISEFTDLILFTAGLEGYARPLVDRIDIENLFTRRLYRPSTVCTEYRDHVKDLSSLSRDLSRTVIVDNNPFSFLLQPLNGIPCIPFSAEQPHDDQLLEVLLPLLKHLSLQKDVRPVLYERFHMPEWFEKHGVSSSLWTYHNSSQET